MTTTTTTRLRCMSKCAYCDENAITELDGYNMCKRHADAWLKGEAEVTRLKADEHCTHHEGVHFANLRVDEYWTCVVREEGKSIYCIAQAPTEEKARIRASEIAHRVSCSSTTEG